MQTPPAEPATDSVLAHVREHWLDAATSARYLPLGFGAHHWRIDDARGPALFATLDTPAGFRTAAGFEAAYRAAADLAHTGFAGVLPPIPARAGGMTAPLGRGESPTLPAEHCDLTVPLGPGVLSVTSWTQGHTPSEQEARSPDHLEQVVALLMALHAATAPATLPQWRPRIGRGFAETLQRKSAEAWTQGPMGEQARAVIGEAEVTIRRWEARYQLLADAAVADAGSWAPTHGEPHFANQMVTEEGLLLVDWESFALAPVERDLISLPEAQRRRLGGRGDMLELFELEWTLSEIEEYARWFRAPHTGSVDDRTALDGLRAELSAS